MPKSLPFACLVLVGLCLAVENGEAQTAEAQSAEAAPRVLVDFRDPDDGKSRAAKLRGDRAEAERTKDDVGSALAVTTDADAPYPGVFIEPAQGKWDLSRFDGVEMELRNPQPDPVRVLLSINNPGANGREHCNVESATVPARGKAKLVVPFGMWHGDPSHPIDQSNVVSLQVLLDRPGRAHRFFVEAVRAVTFGEAEIEDLLADSFFKNLRPVFGRGMNLGNALEAPKEGEWGITLTENDFQQIKAAGFDCVRIPIRWSAHARREAPYTIDPEFFGRVDWAVDQALRRGLKTIVNIHHYEEVMQEPDGHRERFLGLWRQIADHYKDRRQDLVFELLNEPIGRLTAEKWNRLVAEAIAVIRRTNRSRQIVVGPVGANSIKDLAGLELPEDDRDLVVTVHYYSPFRFTHQGASWAGAESQSWLGTRWMGTKAEQSAVRRDFNEAIKWGVEHGRPVFLGEFGAYERADLESRARWTRFIVEEAARRKMGWAYWEFRSGFGAYDAQREEWIEPLKRALLAPSPLPPAERGRR
jgi:aryl-phospho-beta-D-glucosidase BglC (GH1 family)